MAVKSFADLVRLYEQVRIAPSAGRAKRTN
jgi:hypothetical protein